jgi:DNA-binding MarR family transcriptional regulator
MTLWDDRRWDAFGLLREAYLALSERIEGGVQRATGLSPEVADLLFRIARTPGQRLRMKDIAAVLHTTTTRTTRIVDDAQVAGLVRREPDPVDRRATSVTLTAKGRRTAERAGGVALELAQTHLHSNLTRAEVRTLEGLLQALRDGPLP